MRDRFVFFVNDIIDELTGGSNPLMGGKALMACTAVVLFAYMYIMIQLVRMFVC